MAKTSLLILATIFLGVITPSCLSGNILYSGETLSARGFLNYGSFVFIMQEDCINLVLYDVDKPICVTNTGGLSSGCFLNMQTDGNLVMYNPSNKPIWASNTGGQNGNYVCILQMDRNVVIYVTDRWATVTYTGAVGIPASSPSEKYLTAGKIKLVIEK